MYYFRSFLNQMAVLSFPVRFPRRLRKSIYYCLSTLPYPKSRVPHLKPLLWDVCTSWMLPSERSSLMLEVWWSQAHYFWKSSFLFKWDRLEVRRPRDYNTSGRHPYRLPSVDFFLQSGRNIPVSQNFLRFQLLPWILVSQAPRSRRRPPRLSLWRWPKSPFARYRSPRTSYLQSCRHRLELSHVLVILGPKRACLSPLCSGRTNFRRRL